MKVYVGFLIVLVLVATGYGQQLCGQSPTYSCAALVSPYNYTTPFAPDANWNIPACKLGKWTHSDEYRDRWFYFGTRNDSGTQYGRIDFSVSSSLTDMNDFSMPIYFASNATEQRYVFTSPGGYTPNFPRQQTIPWNPIWKPSFGTDHHIIILDDQNGTEWDLWALDVVLPGLNCVFDSTLGRFFDTNTDLCAGSATLLKKSDGSTADYRSFGGVTGGSRGVGIQSYAMLTTAAEIAAGEIRHALAVGVFNTMFGPPCNDSQMSDPAQFGVSCGFAMRPAGLLEKGSYAESAYPSGVQHNSFYDDKVTPVNELRKTTVPEGMRIAVNITDQEIESWLDSNGYSDPVRRSARVIARALRDYGFVISDTGGFATGIMNEGPQNPSARSLWQLLGIMEFTGRLLKGIISRKEQLWVVAPPIDDLGHWWTVTSSPKDSFSFTSDCLMPASNKTTAAQITPPSHQQSASTSFSGQLWNCFCVMSYAAGVLLLF